MYFSKTIFSLKHVFNAGIGFTSSYHFLSLKLLQLYYYHYSNVVTRTEHKTLNSLPESYITREQWMNVVNFKCKIINQLQWWQKPFVTCHNLLSKTFKPISHAEQSVINYDFFSSWNEAIIMTVEFLFWEIRWHLIPWEQMTLTKEQLIILSCKKKKRGGGRERKKNMKENVVALYVKCLLMNL